MSDQTTKTKRQPKPCPCGCGTVPPRIGDRRGLVCRDFWTSMPDKLRNAFTGALNQRDRGRAAKRITDHAKNFAANRDVPRQATFKL